MTVSTTTNRVSYTGSGQTTFNFPYYMQQQSDLGVAIQNTTTLAITPLILNTDYTISGTYTSGYGYESGVTITMLTSTNVPTGNIPTGTNIVLFRQSSPTQTTSLPENGPFSSQSIESSLDEAMLAIQRTLDIAGRSATLQDGDTSGFNPQLPANLSACANSPLMVNAEGTGFTAAPTTGGGQVTATSIFDAVVGAEADCNYTTLALALAAAQVGWRILVRDAATIGSGGNLSIGVNNIYIEFAPQATYTCGSMTGSLFTLTEGSIRIRGGNFAGFATVFTINSGCNYNFITENVFNNCTNDFVLNDSSPNNVLDNNIYHS